MLYGTIEELQSTHIEPVSGLRSSGLSISNPVPSHATVKKDIMLGAYRCHTLTQVRPLQVPGTLDLHHIKRHAHAVNPQKYNRDSVSTSATTILMPLPS